MGHKTSLYFNTQKPAFVPGWRDCPLSWFCFSQKSTCSHWCSFLYSHWKLVSDLLSMLFFQWFKHCKGLAMADMWNNENIINNKFTLLKTRKRYWLLTAVSSLIKIIWIYFPLGLQAIIIKNDTKYNLRLLKIINKNRNVYDSVAHIFIFSFSCMFTS